MKRALMIPRPARVMPPLGSKCRVCGCTEDNACGLGCYWVEVEKGSRPLCSACAGTPRDLIEAMRRIYALMIGQMPSPVGARRTLQAAIKRFNERQQQPEKRKTR